MSAVPTVAPRTLLEERTISLMSRGYAQSVVAATLGVSESRISQILAQEDIAAEVSQKRFDALNKYNTIDEGYDQLEDALQTKLRKSLPMMVKPQEIVKALQIINSAKRRGHAPEADGAGEGTEIVRLSLPKTFKGRLAVVIDSDNRVVSAGDQQLLTAQMSALPTTTPQSGERNDQTTIPAASASSVRNSAQIGYQGSGIRAEDI